ncbi:hypothetical protein VPH35_019444 [Triticum aestivum]
MPGQLLLGRRRQSGLSSPRRRRCLTSLPTSSSPSCHGCRPSPCSGSGPPARPGGPCYPTQVSIRSARRCSWCPARTTPTTSRGTMRTAPSTCPSTGTAPAAPRSRCCCTGRSCRAGSPCGAAPCTATAWELLALPERNQKHCVYTFPRAGLGFDPRSKRYKVARFFYQPLADGLACRFEVLTLGADSAWRQTADPPHWICGRTPAHVNGHIYWTCDGTPAHPDPPDLFLRFSLADEEFSLVPFPRALGGELCCVCFGYSNLDVELWSLSLDGGVDGKPEWRWSGRWATGPRRSCRALSPPRVVLHEGAWLLTEERNVHRYDDRTGEIEKISSGVPDARCRYYRSEKEVVLHLTNYVESLVRIR